jgi:hypothetical protein
VQCYHSAKDYSTLTAEYTGYFTNNKRAAVPWQCLSQDTNHSYIDAASLPDGVLLADPSKLRAVGISQIWDHWASRQKANSQGLLFLKAHGVDMREKPASIKKKAKGAYLEISNVPQTDRGEGASGSNLVHPDSPAASADGSAESRIAFLRRLSRDKVYLKFVKALEEKIGDVSGSVAPWDGT